MALVEYQVLKGKIWHTVDGKRTVASPGDKLFLPLAFGDKKVAEGKLKKVAAPGAENAAPSSEEALALAFLGDRGVAELRTQLPGIDSVAMLRTIAEVEQSRGNRITLLAAIADRIREIEEPDEE